MPITAEDLNGGLSATNRPFLLQPLFPTRSDPSAQVVFVHDANPVAAWPEVASMRSEQEFAVRTAGRSVFAEVCSLGRLLGSSAKILSSCLRFLPDDRPCNQCGDDPIRQVD